MAPKNQSKNFLIAAVLLILSCSSVAGLAATVDCNLCLYRSNPVTQTNPLTNPASCFNRLEVGSTDLIAPFPVSGGQSPNTYLSSFTYFTTEGSECDLCLLVAGPVSSSSLTSSGDLIKDLKDGGLGSFKFCVKSGTVDCEKPEEEEEVIEEEEEVIEEEEEEIEEEEEEIEEEEATQTREGALTSDDPIWSPPLLGFSNECVVYPVNQQYYEAFEFSHKEAGSVTASLCPSRGGNANFDSSLYLYQAPGGARINPFTLNQNNACDNFVVFNDDGSNGCNLESEITRNIGAGYFYFVVTSVAQLGTGSFKLVVNFN